MKSKKHVRRKPQTVLQTPLNELVQNAIRAAKEIQEYGEVLSKSAAPIEQLKKETTPSLAQISRTLTEMAQVLTTRADLQVASLEAAVTSVNSISTIIQKAGSSIQKRLEELDVQLRIERQFSRYLM